MARNDMGEWVRWLAGYAPVCQVCNAQRAIEAHHLYFGCYGADKDDTRLLSVCRECHMWCHRNKKLSQARFGALAIDNWETYQGSKDE